MSYYNTQWHKITYIITKYLTKKEAFFQGFQVLFLTFNCQTPGCEGVLYPGGFAAVMVFIIYGDKHILEIP